MTRLFFYIFSKFHPLLNSSIFTSFTLKAIYEYILKSPTLKSFTLQNVPENFDIELFANLLHNDGFHENVRINIIFCPTVSANFRIMSRLLPKSIKCTNCCYC